MRLIIPCAGEQRGWGNFLGIRKYLAPVFGEKLLHRTIRQFHARIPGLSTVVVLHPDAEIDLPTLSISVEIPPPDLLGESNKLLSSYHLWDRQDRTIIVFGDVFLTDEAVSTILANASACPAWFGRSGPGTMTYWPYSEIFAVAFTAERVLQMRAGIQLAQEAVAAGEIEEAKAFHVYRSLVGIPLTEARFESTYFTEIDDLTQDFDCPECYCRWVQAAGSSQEVL